MQAAPAHWRRLLLLLCLTAALCAPVGCATATGAPATSGRRAGAQRTDRRGARRRGRGDEFWRRGRRRDRGVGAAYRRAVVSAGRGGARFGRHVARGRPVRASKALGRGMGGFGKYTGIGTARAGAKLGRGVKRILTP